MPRRIVAIVQARMGSRRFPGKILRRVGSQVVLTHVLARCRRIPGVDVVHVTTTPDAVDDAIVNRCRGAGVGWTRGQVPLSHAPGRNDVLAGYVTAAAATGATHVLRVTSDCPLLDPAVANQVLRALLDGGGKGYASNVHPPSWYDGTDVEAFDVGTLHEAARHAGPDEREHVTTWMHRHRHVANVSGPSDFSAIKLSIDEPADLARVNKVWDELHGRTDYGWRNVVAAYYRVFPPPAFARARAIYGVRPGAEARITAYLLGALTRDATSTGTMPEVTARHLGVEDADRLALGAHERALLARLVGLRTSRAVESRQEPMHG